MSAVITQFSLTPKAISAESKENLEEWKIFSKIIEEDKKCFNKLAKEMFNRDGGDGESKETDENKRKLFIEHFQQYGKIHDLFILLNERHIVTQDDIKTIQDYIAIYSTAAITKEYSCIGECLELITTALGMVNKLRVELTPLARASEALAAVLREVSNEYRVSAEKMEKPYPFGGQPSKEVADLISNFSIISREFNKASDLLTKEIIQKNVSSCPIEVNLEIISTIIQDNAIPDSINTKFDIVYKRWLHLYIKTSIEPQKMFPN